MLAPVCIRIEEHKEHTKISCRKNTDAPEMLAAREFEPEPVYGKQHKYQREKFSEKASQHFYQLRICLIARNARRRIDHQLLQQNSDSKKEQEDEDFFNHNKKYQAS